VELQIRDARLETAVAAARRAGDAASAVKETTTRERKSDGHIVTAADREAETICREVLTERSDAAILGEEFGGDIDDSDTHWIVDPIDGTKNFSRQQPLYGTAVALVEGETPTVGCFYMPDLDYLFYAVEGQGAYRDETRIEVGSHTAVETAYYTISGIGRTKLHPHVATLNRWIQQTGCALVSESWIASGWVDVGVFGAFAPWDVATGVVLVREAGGVVKAIADESEDWADLREGRCVLGNERIVDSVLDQLPAEVEQIVSDATNDY
jgi:myo-inositol-1(or 4)-monophosphatase